MRRAPRTWAFVAVAAATLTFAACEEQLFLNHVALTAFVSMRDQCDPATFNAALGPGTCVRQGNVTFQQFNAELAATGRVSSWLFVPNGMTMSVGQGITGQNDGGEVHTFTEVLHFGGGVLPALNTASNNPVMAPECGSAVRVTPGTTFRTNAPTTAGTRLFQCCIHPWMRATVVWQ